MVGTRAITLRFGNLSIEDLKAIEGYADEITLWGYERDDCYYFDISFRATDVSVNRYGINIINENEDWDLKFDFPTDDFEYGFFVDIVFHTPDPQYAVEVPYEVFEQFYYDDDTNGACIAEWWKKRTGSTRG